MKLYTTPGGQWAGTEKDWKAALKAEGIDPKTYTGRGQVDVPTSKPNLLEFLTFYNVNVIAPRGDASAGGPTPPPAPPAEVTTKPSLEELRALHNPEASPGFNPGLAPPPPPVVVDLGQLFLAATIKKQVELAVGLLDRLEAVTN